MELTPAEQLIIMDGLCVCELWQRLAIELGIDPSSIKASCPPQSSSLTLTRLLVGAIDHDGESVKAALARCQFQKVLALLADRESDKMFLSPKEKYMLEKRIMAKDCWMPLAAELGEDWRLLRCSDHPEASISSTVSMLVAIAAIKYTRDELATKFEAVTGERPFQ